MHEEPLHCHAVVIQKLQCSRGKCIQWLKWPWADQMSCHSQLLLEPGFLHLFTDSTVNLSHTSRLNNVGNIILVKWNMILIQLTGQQIIFLEFHFGYIHIYFELRKEFIWPTAQRKSHLNSKLLGIEENNSIIIKICSSSCWSTIYTLF